ncbi:MAG: hypothetical protein WCT42_02245 [Candidatus Paceibacterota bacterium]
MNDDERKPRLHINIGGLIILIIIILILFKVDIKSKIKSPQFQKNVTYIEDTVKGFYVKYIANPLKIKASGLFRDVSNEGVKKMQDNFNNTIFKVPSNKDIEKATN